MKMTIALSKPRNPLVALSIRRRAGSHRTDGRTQRQQAGRSLQRELDRLRPSP